jgi:predicted small lipoprotein YifL
MKAWIAILILLAVSACGRYGPPIRSAAVHPTPPAGSAAAEECPPEEKE